MVDRILMNILNWVMHLAVRIKSLSSIVGLSIAHKDDILDALAAPAALSLDWLAVAASAVRPE